MAKPKTPKPEADQIPEDQIALSDAIKAGIDGQPADAASKTEIVSTDEKSTDDPQPDPSREDQVALSDAIKAGLVGQPADAASKTEIVGTDEKSADDPQPDPSRGAEGQAAAGEGQPSPDTETTKPDAKAPLRQPATHIVMVKGPQAGRWRIGMHFGPEPVEVDCAQLTEAQQKALGADPALTIWLKD